MYLIQDSPLNAVPMKISRIKNVAAHLNLLKMTATIRRTRTVIIAMVMIRLVAILLAIPLKVLMLRSV